MEEIKNMSQAIRQVIDGLPEGQEFHGNELKKMVVKIYPSAKYTYVASVLHCMRIVRGDVVKCINRDASLYRIERKDVA